MIPEKKYPDLASETERRATGILMAVEMMGAFKAISDIGLFVMVKALARLVDGTFLDYQAARQAYYRFYQDEGLGTSLSISAALVPTVHHIENCLSNLKRVREMADAIRIRKLSVGMDPLINKNDWKIVETHEDSIKDLRNAVQHNHKDLKEGKHDQGAIQFHGNGNISLGNNVLALSGLAETLQSYRRISENIVKILGKTNP